MERARKSYWLPVSSFAVAMIVAWMGGSGARGAFGFRAAQAMTCEKSCKGSIEGDADYKVTDVHDITPLGIGVPPVTPDPTKGFEDIKKGAEDTVAADVKALLPLLNCKKGEQPPTFEIKPLGGTAAAGAVGASMYMYARGKAQTSLIDTKEVPNGSGGFKLINGEIVTIETQTIDGEPIEAGWETRNFNVSHTERCTSGQGCRRSSALIHAYGITDAGFMDLITKDDRELIETIIRVRDLAVAALKKLDKEKIADVFEKVAKKLNNFASDAELDTKFDLNMKLNGIEKNLHSRSRIKYQVTEDLEVKKGLLERGAGECKDIFYFDEDQDIEASLTGQGPHAKARATGKRTDAIVTGGTGWLVVGLMRCDKKAEAGSAFFHSRVKIDQKVVVDPRETSKVDTLGTDNLAGIGNSMEGAVNTTLGSTAFQNALDTNDWDSMNKQLKDLNTNLEKICSALDRKATSTPLNKK